MNVSLLEHIEFFIFLSSYCRLLINIVGTVFRGPSFLHGKVSGLGFLGHGVCFLKFGPHLIHGTSDPLLAADGITPISNCQPYIDLFILDFLGSGNFENGQNKGK